MPTVLIALFLAALLVLPADALRFELIRALRARPDRLAAVLVWRLVVTVPLSLLLVWAVTVWAGSGPAGPAMVVFAGALAALWLWMRFWIRTFVADPHHPTLATGAGGVALPSALSASLWLAVFTQAALTVAWADTTSGRVAAVLVWPLLDAGVLVWGARSARAGRLVSEEGGQRRLGRLAGSALVLLAGWAMWVVLAQ